MADAPQNVRYRQLRSQDRHGTRKKVQMSDGTGVFDHLAKYDDNGSVTNSTIAESDVVTKSGGGLVGSGGSPGGAFPHGAWYGQVPRGTVDGVNKVFTLDYTLASPFTILSTGGHFVAKPPRDGPNPMPGPDYAISGHTLTYRYAPKTTDGWHYIWYFAGDPAPPVNGTITAATLYLTSAHFPSSSGNGSNFGAMASFTTIGTIIPVPDWFHSQAGWDKRTDSIALTTGNGQLAKFLDGSINLIVGLEQDGSDTGTFSPAEEYWIYDCYIVATYADATTRIWRPTEYTEGILTASSVGSITNPENVIDADDATYSVLSANHFMGGGLDGVYLNLNTFQSTSGVGAGFGGAVDVINGGGNTSGGTSAPGSGVGVTGNTTSADLIAADMTMANQGSAMGSSYGGPVVNSLPADTQALSMFTNLYVDSGGNPATNTQVAVKQMQMWWFNTATSQWINGFGPTNVFDGGYYTADLGGSQIAPISFSAQSDGSRSYTVPAGEVAHTAAPSPRAAINAAQYGGMVVVTLAKLVPIDPAGTNDTASAKLLLDAGATPYPSATGVPPSEPVTLASGALKYVTSSWQSFAATDMSKAALDANPPPIDLTNLNPTAGGGTGGGTTGISSPGVPTGYSLVYGEEFDGSSLPSPWGLGYYFNTNVPSSAVTVNNSAVHLTWTRGSSNPDMSISTSTSYKYGYFEARMKWPTTVGAWPAFWLIPFDGSGNSGEIDIFEGEGGDPATYFGTIHEWNGPSHLWASSPNDFPVGVDFSQWHTYGVLWEPGGVFTWYLDGNPIHTVTAAGSIPGVFDTENCFMILSMQEGANWSPGNLAGVSASSLTLDVDYVRVYQN